MPQYGIEINGPHNENAVFSPTSTRLRGRWEMAKVAHRDREKSHAGEAYKALAVRVAVIPGIYILLDTDKRAGTIMDPMAETKEGKDILAEVNAVFKEYPAFFGGQIEPVAKTTTALTIDQVKTWANYMRQMVDSGLAKGVGGTAVLPPRPEIALWPGKRRRDPLNLGLQTAVDDSPREFGLYPWADEVPVGELAGVGAGGDGGAGGGNPPAGDKGGKGK